MKKKQVLLVGILLLYLPLTTANLYITEVMHSPTQMSDTEGEWLELYNDGSGSIDLSTWTVDGKGIGNGSISPGEYIILARELLDDEDTDSESFESYWGNNNNIWDEPFTAIEVALSLKEEDTIVVTNGIVTEEVSYNKSFGGSEGKTIERISFLEWQEGPLDGTPGAGNFSTAEENENIQSIELFIEILNSIPEILSVSITDDGTEEGIQLLPEVGKNKTIAVEVVVNDSDGFEDIEHVSFSLATLSGNMTFVENTTTTVASYQTNISLDQAFRAGEYTLSVVVFDGINSTEVSEGIEYEGIVATELNVSSFKLSMHSGTSEVRSVELINNGNVVIDTEIAAEDLSSGDQSISKSALEIFDNVWLPLTQPVFLNANIAPQEAKEFQFRFTPPQETKTGQYKGEITITSMESSSDDE